MKFPALFSAGRIGKLVLKNRLLMPPMVLNYADADGKATQRYIDHIERVARGGVGGIILEASFIRTVPPSGSSSITADDRHPRKRRARSRSRRRPCPTRPSTNCHAS